MRSHFILAHRKKTATHAVNVKQLMNAHLSGKICIIRCECAFRAWHAAKLLTQHVACTVFQLVIIVSVVGGSSARGKGTLQSLVAKGK